MSAHAVQPTKAEKRKSLQLTSYLMTHKSAHVAPCTRLVQRRCGLRVHPASFLLCSQLRRSNRGHCGLVRAASAQAHIY